MSQSKEIIARFSSHGKDFEFFVDAEKIQDYKNAINSYNMAAALKHPLAEALKKRAQKLAYGHPDIKFTLKMGE